MRNWKISDKAISKQLLKLTIIAKQLIVIIIVSFENNKQFDYNENRQNITKIG